MPFDEFSALDRIDQIVHRRCGICNDLREQLSQLWFPNIIRRRATLNRDRDLEIIASSKDSRCPYCRLIILAIWRFRPEIYDEDIENYRVSINLYSCHTFQVHVLDIKSVSRSYDVILSIDIYNPIGTHQTFS